MQTSLKTLLISTCTAMTLMACQPAAIETTPNAGAAPSLLGAEQIIANNVAINTWFEKAFNDSVMRSPMSQTYLGIKTEDYGKWDDPSQAFEDKELEISKGLLKDLTTKFDPSALGETEAVSFELMKAQLEDDIESYKWRKHSYPFNQMFGAHSGTPSFLINQHTVSTKDDAKAYISRILGVKDYMAATVARSNDNAENGVQPPAFVYPLLLDDIQNLVKGAPFDDGKPSALQADFSSKVDALEISDDEKGALKTEANAALLSSFLPAYKSLYEALDLQRKTATDDDGVWRLPNGEDFYAYRLKKITTTNMSASQIHELGLSEVARIHDEMREIMKTVGFEGSLQDFLVYMRDDPDGRFTYPNTAEGKAAYLADSVALIDTMKPRLDEVFIKKPKAELTVKAVEAFREKTAGKAFYNRPAADGSRPGIYYVNLYNMDDVPIYQMEALAYHEAIPGHHMQIAIGQELGDIPKFRKYGGYTAYIEGWGLYSEYLPKEMGLYQDPYSDFGRLAMELWRAGRLVVDTGLHDKKWTREKAISYLVENTPNSENDCRKAIERYIVMPGQATAYKIGMIKIQTLREQAKQELGEAFDIREFHDIVLAAGSVPLTVLETRVNNWISSKT